MQTTKKWWQSRTIQAASALIIAGLSFFAIQYGAVDYTQLESAATVYPEVKNGISLIKAGQFIAGLSSIGGALVIYFRVNAKKLVS